MASSLARFALALALALAFWIGDSTPALALNLGLTGYLAIGISNFPLATISGNGTAILNGSGGGGHLNTLALPAGLFATTGLTITDGNLVPPPPAPLNELKLTAMNQAGAFSGGTGSIPLAGVVKICLFAPCSQPPPGNLNVPLSVVGAGGTAFVTGPVNLTVIGAPWTTGTVAIGTITATGFAVGPHGNESSTAATSGRMSLVTPIFISTSQPSIAVIPAFAHMELHFVPEPETLVLFVGGLALLARGHARRKRSTGA